MKKSSRKRSITLSLSELERRCLLSASGTWLGQDGHDLVGPSATPGPDDVQDIHIALSGLPTNLTVTQADIQGYGGGEWMYNGPSNGPWAAALLQTPGATTADLYLDPYQTETGRQFWIDLTFNDGTSEGFWVAGGTANPNLRMPGQSMAAQWIGQDGHDLTGPGPDVGPDGIQDVHLKLTNLSSDIAVQSLTIDASGGAVWQYGLNPQLDANAELVPDPNDPTQADLYFNPSENLNGQTLTLSLLYSDGKSDTTSLVAGTTDPTLQMPAAAPVTLTWNVVTASWIGQDGQNLLGPGDVHVALSGLPSSRKVVSATLSDEAGISWTYNPAGSAAVNPNAQPLAFARSATNPTQADIDFPPVRDESNATLTLVLVLDDGTMLATRFLGGTSNPTLQEPAPPPTSITAHPGDNLNLLANMFGTVHLSAGTYALSQPLILNNPVTITADPGTTLLFSQGPNDPTWTAAIKINVGRTTLEGFAVRFATSIRWTAGISYGPAVIGTTDNFDVGKNDPKIGITISNLNLMSTLPSTTWEQAPSLMRLVSAQSGVISNNILKGGTTELLNGPWQIVGNNYQGTVPDTFTDSAFAVHYTHDVVIANNVVQPVGPSGKTWRFLVMTQSGIGDVVQNNTVVGVGPMDSDTIPNPNASEALLTEAYRLHFEGITSAISPDGWIVQIPTPQGGPANTGDVLSILTGPQAGQWRMIAQQLNPTTYLLDAPIAAGSGNLAVSISTGFVNETFEGNTINAVGSSTELDMVLAGNHFGTRVLNNLFIGGAWGFQIFATPTEAPDIWGWSHAPFLGAVISGNTLENTLQGGWIDVQHGAPVKSNQGRVYMTVTLSDNTAIWTAAFLAQRAQSGNTASLHALTIGDSFSVDPMELVISELSDDVQVPPGTLTSAMLMVNAAKLNGQAVQNQLRALPSVLPAPTGLALVNDSGASKTDGITNDGRLRFNPVPGAVGYQYRLGTASGPGQPIASPAAFLPAGLSQGPNTVSVWAIDASGRAGPAASITFNLASVPSPTTTGQIPTASGQVPSPGFSPITMNNLYLEILAWRDRLMSGK